MIGAILFDLDGVLVDACDWHYLALNRALEEVVGSSISREDHVTRHNSRTLRSSTRKDKVVHVTTL